MTGVPVGSLLAELRARDVRFELRGERVHVDAPRAALSETERLALKAVRDELRSHLEIERAVIGMSFEEFAQADFAIEIAVPWLDRSLWLIPHAKYIDQLLAQGVERGRIWTAAEMADLYTIDGVEPSDRVSIAKLKATFGATVLSVEPRQERDGPQQSETRWRRCPACRGTRFWRSIYNVIVCARCHPPAAPQLVAEWLDQPVTEGD